MAASRPAVCKCFCFLVGGDCGRWVVYRLTSGGTFRSWAARWLLSGGAPAVDVLCAVVAVVVEEGVWRRAVCSYASTTSCLATLCASTPTSYERG